MVKSKLFTDSLALAAVILNTWVPHCDAAHGHHHHKDVLDRVMHKAAAGTGGSFNATGALVEPTSERLNSSQQSSTLLTHSKLQF